MVTHQSTFDIQNFFDQDLFIQVPDDCSHDDLNRTQEYDDTIEDPEVEIPFLKPFIKVVKKIQRGRT